MIIGLASKNIPANNNMATTININIIGFVVIFVIESLNLTCKLFNVIIQDTMLAIPIKNRTTDVIIPDLIINCGKCSNFKSLLIKNPTNSAYATAIAADSVGVNILLTIPPIII